MENTHYKINEELTLEELRMLRRLNAKLIAAKSRGRFSALIPLEPTLELVESLLNKITVEIWEG